MRIALLTEGSYPTAHGGVSLWCDQLTTGLSEYEFDVQAIVATGTEPIAWTLPPNVVDVTLLPLWGQAAKHTTSRADTKRFLSCFEQMLDAMLAPGPREVDEFVCALRGLLPFARGGQLPPLLTSPKVIDLLLRRWRRRPAPGRPAGEDSVVPAPTVADAVLAIGLLDHFLRPLGAKAPEADLCHAVSNGLACLVAFSAKWTNGVPFLLTEHGLYLRERYLEYRASNFSFAVRGFVLRFLRLLTSASYVVADFITPGSDYNRRWAVRHGASEDRVRPVYNGVDPSAFTEGPEPEAPVLSWAGRIAPIKDVEGLITAFGLVRREIPDARLRLFGSAPPGNEGYLDRCQALINRLGLADAATFEGRVDDIVDAYHAGQVVVLSSSSEGFPYTVIEAMTSGRATVSTDVGGVREAVGDTGLVVPARDPQALAAACVLVLNDHELRHRLALAARARALQHFTLEQFLAVYREIYPALAKRQYSRAKVQRARAEVALDWVSLATERI
jgi:glycosyltransferase involved in cell wall biosynthesis